MSEWISVKDRLPELHQQVLGYDGSNIGVYERVYIDFEGWFWGYCYNGFDDDAEVDDDYKVTHWMPKPDPPGDQDA